MRLNQLKLKFSINYEGDSIMTCELSLFNTNTNKVLKTNIYDCNYSEGEEKVRELNAKLNKKKNNNSYWKLTTIYR